MQAARQTEFELRDDDFRKISSFVRSRTGIVLNERKRKLIDDERRNLRTAAKVQYVGKFAQEGGSRPVVASSTPVAVAAAGAASAGMTSADIMKGMGIK